MANNLVLAIDIGSSRTHMAVVDTDALVCANRFIFRNNYFDEKFVSSIENILLTHSDISRINITSCSLELTHKASALCEEKNRFGRSFGFVKAAPNMPVSFNYDLGRLGSDRVCDALACASIFKGKDCVIIDSGTAVTIDYLYGGNRFIGGAILPGITMQRRALQDGTSLPYAKLTNADKGTIKPLGTSTESCIAAGVIYGVAGAIEKLVYEYQYVSKNAAPVTVATGGGWENIEPYVKLDQEAIYIPDLTLIGAALYKSSE